MGPKDGKAPLVIETAKSLAVARQMLQDHEADIVLVKKGGYTTIIWKDGRWTSLFVHDLSSTHLNERKYPLCLQPRWRGLSPEAEFLSFEINSQAIKFLIAQIKVRFWRLVEDHWDWMSLEPCIAARLAPSAATTRMLIGMEPSGWVREAIKEAEVLCRQFWGL